MDDETFQQLVDQTNGALPDGDTESALTGAEELIAECRARFGDTSSETLGWRAFRAKALIEARRYLDAEAELSEVLILRERLEGVDSPGTMRVRGNLARAMALNGRTEEALLIVRRLLDDRRRLLGDDHPETLDTEGHIAHFTYLSGDRAASAELYGELLEKRRRILGHDHPVTLQTEQNLIAVSAVRGDQQSLERLRESARAIEESEGPDHSSTLNAYGILAERLVSAKQFGEALDLARHVRAGRERMFGSSHAHVLSTRHTLARALHGLGRIDEALAELFSILDVLDLSGLEDDANAVRVMCDIIEFAVSLLPDEEEDENELLSEDDIVRVWGVWLRLNALATSLPPDHIAHEVIADYAEVFQDDDEDATGGKGHDHSWDGGVLDIASPDDERHRLHWRFAFYLIPVLFLPDAGDALLDDLGHGNCSRLSTHWIGAGGDPADASQFSSVGWSIPGGNLVVVTMPDVRSTNEAIFVAIARADEASTSWGGPTGKRFLYLESSLFGTMLGELREPGQHITHGPGCEPLVESFADLVYDLLVDG